MNTTDTLDLTALPFYQWEAYSAGPQADTVEEYVGVAMMDSVFAEREVTEPPVRMSMFQGQTLEVSHQEPLPRADATAPAWLFALLVVLTTACCLFVRTHKIKLSELGSSLFDSRAMERLLRGANIMRRFQQVPMALLLTVAIALPVGYWGAPAVGYASWAGCLLLWPMLVVAYLVRNLLIRLLGSIYDNEAAASLYITSNYVYHLALALLLVPLLYLHFYLPAGRGVMGYVVLGVVGLELIIRLVRGMKLFLTQSSGPQFYLFYYLCTVEIVPILVLIKLL